MDISDIIQLNYITKENASFQQMEGGFLKMIFNGTEYERIKLKRALPYRKPKEYISVFDCNGKEIGIIRSIDDFDEEQKSILLFELDYTYFCPIVKKITGMKKHSDLFHMQAETSAGSKLIFIENPVRDIRFVDQERNRIEIKDVNGNKYIIEDFKNFDQKSVKKIEFYLVR